MLSKRNNLQNTLTPSIKGEEVMNSQYVERLWCNALVGLATSPRR